MRLMVWFACGLLAALSVIGPGCARTKGPPGAEQTTMRQDAQSAGQSVANAVTKPVGKVLGTFLEWEAKSENTDDEKPLIDPVDAYRFGYNTRWITSIGNETNDLSHAVVLEDLIVLVEEGSHFVTGINMRDGEIRWQRIVGGSLERLFEPVRFYEEILINSETMLYSIHADTGQEVGRSEMEAAVVDKPAIVDDYAVFGGLHSRAFAHGIRTGRTHWAYKMTGGIVVRPVASGINVFVTDSNGVYALIQGKLGEVEWKGQTFGRISAVPAVNSLGVFVACEDQTLYALNRATGNDRWKFRSPEPLKKPPHILENTLFLPHPSGELVAIDALSGEELWRYPGQAQPVTLSDDKLLLAEPTRLVSIDMPTGKTIRQSTMQKVQKVLPGPEGSLILVSARGRLMRLDPSQ